MKTAAKIIELRGQKRDMAIAMQDMGLYGTEPRKWAETVRIAKRSGVPYASAGSVLAQLRKDGVVESRATKGKQGTLEWSLTEDTDDPQPPSRKVEKKSGYKHNKSPRVPKDLSTMQLIEWHAEQIKELAEQAGDDLALLALIKEKK